MVQFLMQFITVPIGYIIGLLMLVSSNSGTKGNSGLAMGLETAVETYRGFQCAQKEIDKIVKENENGCDTQK